MLIFLSPHISPHSTTLSPSTLARLIPLLSVTSSSLSFTHLFSLFSHSPYLPNLAPSLSLFPLIYLYLPLLHSPSPYSLLFTLNFTFEGDSGSEIPKPTSSLDGMDDSNFIFLSETLRTARRGAGKRERNEERKERKKERKNE